MEELSRQLKEITVCKRKGLLIDCNTHVNAGKYRSIIHIAIKSVRTQSLHEQL